MKWQRCVTSTPGHPVSTMKAVIGRLPFTPSLAGVRAMTTMISDRGPLVVQSFSPFRMKAFPSSVGVAVVAMFAGSDPTSGSVSAKAERAPLARRGR